MQVDEKRLVEILPEVSEYSWIFYTEPDNFDDMLNNYACSQLWRLCNLYTVVDKDGKLVSFVLNESQLLIYAEYVRHGRQLILKSRQQGISTFYLVLYFDNATHIPHRTVGMQAQGREESTTLLERVKRLWSNLDDNYKMHALGGIERVKDSATEQSYSNDSTIYIRTSFRSATLHDLHVSEFGKTASKYPDKANEIISGSLEACAARRGNNVAIESTAEGEDKFKEMWDESVATPPEERSAEDFMPIFLAWQIDPDCVNNTPQSYDAKERKYFERNDVYDERRRNFYIAKKRRLKSRMTKEYPSTPDEAFQAALELAFYASLYGDLVQEERIRHGLFDPALPVYAAVDLGISLTDLFCVVYFQELTSNDDIRIIGEDYGRDEDIPYYCSLMDRREWEIDAVYLPHDASVRSLNDKKTRTKAFQEQGYRVRVVKRSGLLDGIDRVRQYIPRMLIDDKCTMVKKTMINYVKVYDEKLQLARAVPLHNFWSHMADALRTAIMGSKNSKAPKPINTSDKTGVTSRKRAREAKRARSRRNRRTGGI